MTWSGEEGATGLWGLGKSAHGWVGLGDYANREMTIDERELQSWILFVKA